jgi:multiple sugar transport system ATP-binding protein
LDVLQVSKSIEAEFMSKLTIRDLTKRYDSAEGVITAVDGVDLDVRDGEILVLVGPSGCGKSTTLRSIAGLESPDEGEILIGEAEVTNLRPKDRNVAMVFQNYALYPNMTVAGNIGYGLEKSTDLSSKEITSKVNDIAEMMGINDLLEKKPAELSGGQKQRVSTGRALVRDPDVLLLDEPLSNLDAKLRMHMRTEIQQIQDEFDTTAIYVTHNQEEAMTIGDRIAVMYEGRIQQIGTPEEIYSQPESRFIAEFIGNPGMNLLTGSISNGKVVSGPCKFPIETNQVDENKRYLIGIRPEAIRLDESTGVEATASINLIEPTGSEVIVHLQAGGDELIAKLPRGEQHPDEGEEVTFGVAPSDIYLFEDRNDSAQSKRVDQDGLAAGI